MAARRRYGGAYIPAEKEAVDPKEAIDKKCGYSCTGAWDHYMKCADRIEAKVRHAPCQGPGKNRTTQRCVHAAWWPLRRLPTEIMTPLPPWQGHGECSGYYMDYFKCVDKCSVKNLFKELS